MKDEREFKEEADFFNLYCEDDPRMCPTVITENGELFQMFDVDLDG